MRVFVLRNNVYSQIQNIENEAALHVIVYENNHRIVAEKSLFFSDVISFDGKKDNTYMMRFYSPTHKLVIVNHNKLVGSSHFSDKIVSDKMRNVEDRLASTNNKLNYIFKTLRTTYRIEFEERSMITDKFNTFSYF